MLFLLLAPMFVHAQLPQTDQRWVLVSGNSQAEQLTYVDKQTIKINDDFEGHEKVYLIWVRVYQKLPNGKYSKQIEARMAFDLIEAQYEIKSAIAYKNGKTTNAQGEVLNWQDIAPETVGEFVLNYCKKLNQ